MVRLQLSRKLTCRIQSWVRYVLGMQNLRINHQAMKKFDSDKLDPQYLRKTLLSGPVFILGPITGNQRSHYGNPFAIATLIRIGKCLNATCNLSRRNRSADRRCRRSPQLGQRRQYHCGRTIARSTNNFGCKSKKHGESPCFTRPNNILVAGPKTQFIFYQIRNAGCRLDVINDFVNPNSLIVFPVARRIQCPRCMMHCHQTPRIVEHWRTG